MNEIIIKGKITIEDSGETSDAVMMDGEPIARELEDIHERVVTVSYYITDEEKTEQELLENSILVYTGAAEAIYNERYSEYTGYLWTKCI